MILQPDAKCALCNDGIFFRGKNFKLQMWTGVARTSAGRVIHHNCVIHAQQETKRKLREQRQGK